MVESIRVGRLAESENDEHFAAAAPLSNQEHPGRQLTYSATQQALRRTNNLVLDSLNTPDSHDANGPAQAALPIQNSVDTPQWIREENARHRRILTDIAIHQQLQQQNALRGANGIAYQGRFRVNLLSSNNVSDFLQNQENQVALQLQQQQQAMNQQDQDSVLSSGKLCKYFFTQMSVTILFLIIFEADSDVPEYIAIENFLVVQCIILVCELLFFLFKSGKANTNVNGDAFESVSQRWDQMNGVDIFNSFVSILLYIVQIGWLVYGNYLYFNLPVEVTSSEFRNSETAAETIIADETEYPTPYQSEVDSEQWLYISLMTVLTIGYVHLMIFIALFVIFLVYTVAACLGVTQDIDSMSTASLISPVKLWVFIDEGIFSLLDEIDEDEDYIAQNNAETRAQIERRLALQKLDEKPFETVRLDTIEQIREGNVRGNLHSFRSPSNASVCSPHNRVSPSGRNMRNLFEFAGRSNQAQPMHLSSGMSQFHHTRSGSQMVQQTGSANLQPPMSQSANPQAGFRDEDPMFDYQRMRNPETYFVPEHMRERSLTEQQLKEAAAEGGRSAIECAICQETFTRVSMVCQMPCHIKHIFHSSCIKPWIEKQNACPLCKQAIPVSQDRLPSLDDDEEAYMHRGGGMAGLHNF